MAEPYSLSLHFTPAEFIRSCSRTDRHLPMDKESFFAFPYSYIVLDYGGATIHTQDQKPIDSPKAYIHPPRAYPFWLEKAAGTSFITIVLQPTAFFGLTGLDANSRQLIPLEKVLGPADTVKLYDRCYQLSSAQEIHQALQDTLEPYQNNNLRYPTPLRGIVEDILSNKGKISVEDLLNKYPYSLSSLNRYFKKYLGMTAGLYIRLVKFNSFTSLMSWADVKLKDLSDEFNYYDQSHFFKDFKKFAGISPTEYRGPNYEFLHQAFRYI